MEKFATLETTSSADLPGAERVEQPLPLLDGRLALDHRGVEGGGELVELVDVLPDHQRGLPRVLLDQPLDHVDLVVGARRQPVALLRLRGRVGEALVRGQRDPDLDAVGRGDVALRLDVLPGRVVALRADQREHVALAPVLAHQRRGEAEAAACLEVGGHPEDRRRQQVHLVVQDQAPVAGVEQLEVGVDALPAGGQHLVRRDGDRADLLDGAGVLADLVGGQRRPLDQLVLPLARGDGVGDQDQRGRLGVAHRGRPDQRLAGPAGQHHDPGSAVPEGLGGLGLVGPQLPVALVERDRVRLAVDVPGVVLGRPAQLEQRLLEVAALGGVHHHGVVVEPLAEHPGDLLRAQHLLEHRPVVADQDQAVHRVLLETQPPEAGHRLGDVDQQRVRDGVAGVGQQGVDDLLRVVAGGPGVPEAERREPVGVDVLGAALELGERRDRAAALGRGGVVDLQQQRLVGLDDQGSVVHADAAFWRARYAATLAREEHRSEQ